MIAHRVCVGVSLNANDAHIVQNDSVAVAPSSSVVPSLDSSHKIQNARVDGAPAPSLDFGRGIQFEKDFRSKFGHSVNFVEGFRRREFWLVISFGCSKFKLDIHTVSIVLQACFGGIASRFHVKLLRDRTFSFLSCFKISGLSYLQYWQILG
jgi:hypothetical protein